MFVVVVYLNPSLPPTLPPTLAASNAICRLCKAAEIQTVYQTISKKRRSAPTEKKQKKKHQTVQVSCQNGN